MLACIRKSWKGIRYSLIVLELRDEGRSGIKEEGPAGGIQDGAGLEGPGPYWPGSIVVETEAEARAAVRQAHAAGYDFIKVYNQLQQGPYVAILDEAGRLGIPVVGHVPRGLRVVSVATLHDAREAMEAIGAGEADDLPTCTEG